MEYYIAEDKRPLDRCLDDVASCDVYVGIFAWRYGYVPSNGNPDGLSITELEYRHALASGKACLIFLLSDEAPWPPARMERAALDRIYALREELASRHETGMFENADELARKVSEAVVHWEKRAGLDIQREMADWSAYRRTVSDRHRWIRLQVIAGASADREPLRIPLAEVFEPQLVTEGASGTEIPDEIRKYQQEIYSAQPNTIADADSVAAEPALDHEDFEDDTAEHMFSGNLEQVLDILGRERTQVILGGPGSGKSTLLQYAMLIACGEEDKLFELLPSLSDRPVPFLVELRNYALQQDMDFVSYIARRSKEFYASVVDADSVNNILDQNGKALVFFDGLDEIFDPDARRRVVDQFQAFATRYQGTRIVVTSRIAGYDKTSLGLAGFAHYTLMPLTLSHIRNFAEDWYQYYMLDGTDRTAQGLVQRIAESPRLLDLAGNPLLLTMMAVIYKNRDLPSERWRLYERCAETLLEDWDLGKGIQNEDFKLAVNIRTAQKSELLQRVAMYMLQHNSKGYRSELNAIAYTPLLTILADYLEEKYLRSRGEAEAIAVDILRYLMERTYVLAGIGERIFGFVHRTFMEYFAACCCQAEFNARKSDFTWLTEDIFGAHWKDPEWREVLLLLIAMLHDQGTPIHDVVESIINREISIWRPDGIAFAARCLGETGVAQDQKYGQVVLARLATAIEDSVRIASKTGAEFVDTALESFSALAPHVLIPSTVHNVIAKIDELGTVDARTVAWQMGFALRTRKERLPYALEALKNPAEAVCRGAISALEREWPGRPEVGPKLAEVVGTDRQGRIRLAALSAIQRSWRHELAILDAIAGRAQKEKSYTFVTRLIQYLATSWPMNPQALDLVVELAAPKVSAPDNYNYENVVVVAADAIYHGWAGHAKARALLRRMIARYPAGQVRAAAFYTSVYPLFRTQGHWPYRGAEPAIQKLALTSLTEGFSNPDAAIRQIAIQLSSMLLSNEFAYARAQGVRPRVAAAIIDLIRDRTINDSDMLLRIIAFESLAWLVHNSPRRRSRPEHQQVWAFLKESHELLRMYAINCPHAAGRASALWALTDSSDGDVKTLAFLRSRAVYEKDWHVRASAFEAISWGWGDSTQVLGFLLNRALEDPTPGARRLANDVYTDLTNGKSTRNPKHYIPSPDGKFDFIKRYLKQSSVV